MAIGNRLYTGTNTGVEIKPLDKLSQAQTRMDDMLVKADELKYKTFKENEDWFLKQTKIDPKMYVSQKHAEVQSRLLQAYNDSAAKLVKQRGGFENLTMEDKLAMQRERQNLESAQARMLADEERSDLDLKTALSKPDYYDVEDVYRRQRELGTTGVYDESPLKIRAKSVSSVLQAASQKKTDRYASPVLENGMRASEWQNFDPNDPTEVDRFIVDTILNDPQAQQGLIEEFASQPVDVQLKYLDTDNSGTLDANERSVLKGTSITRGNPLLKYAVENPDYRKNAVTMGGSNFVPITQPKTKAGGVPVTLAGKEVEMTPGVRRTQVLNYGGKDYSGLYSFGGNTTIYNIPTTNGMRLYANTESPMGDTGGTSMEGQLVDYDPKSKTILVRAAAGIPTLSIKANQLVRVPVTNIEGWEKIPIKDEGGTVTTLGALSGMSSPATQTKKKAY